MQHENGRVVPRYMQAEVQPLTPIESVESELSHQRSVRPFLVTGGRTATNAKYDLRIESQLLAIAHPRNHSFEHASVLELAKEPIALAEVAAHLRLPIGAIKVLVSDLVAADALQFNQPPDTANSPNTIRELINAVSAL